MKKDIILCFVAMFSIPIIAQENPANTGLKQAQNESHIPVSRGDIIMPVRKNKVKERSELVSTGDNSFIINKGWELIEAEKTSKDGAKISSGEIKTDDWYNATVPGTVLTTLVDQGVYPDPYFGLNNLAIPDDLARKDWWYQNEFAKPKMKQGERVWLLFNGINYAASVWLNGKKLGSIKGAFIRGEFEITDLVQAKNTLAVHIIPPPNPGLAHEASARSPRGPNGGAMCQDGPTFISSEGWDWVPTIRDRNIGIWQDVRLKVAGSARIIDPNVITDLNLPDTTIADLTIRTEIEATEAGSYRLDGVIGGISFSKKIQIKKGLNDLQLTSDDIKKLKIKEPKLWWPNGYGEQNLHYLKLTLRDPNNEVVDSKRIRFGIRETSYEFAVASEDVDFQRIEFNPIDAFNIKKEALFDNVNRKDYQESILLPTLHEGIDLDMFPKLEGDNPYLIVKVNGVPIFCKGGNWGMDDAMKRVSRERLEPYFKLHKEANYTMIRNWTGESTEEVFYELADEYGMLIWNDFWMSTQGYNMPPADNELFMENAMDVVKRFRNHPSIVVWCARNEGYAPEGLDKPLANLIAKEDGTRMYQSNSRYLNLRPSGPWNHRSDINFYFAERAEGFSTEVGTYSFPTVESMQNMMPAEDLWPINDVWYYHDAHADHGFFRADITELYGEPFTLEDFNRKAQLINYRNHRAIYEAWNAKLWDNASGILLWMTHPAWPSTVWQTYSWDYETYGAFYGAKKANEPIHIQLNNHDNKVLAINTTLVDYPNAKAVVTVLDLNGNVLQTKEGTIDSKANNKSEFFSFYTDKSIKGIYLIRLKMYDEDGVLLSQNAYWRSTNWINKYFDFNDLENAELTGKVNLREAGSLVKGTLTVRNSDKVAALNLKFNLRNSDTADRVLLTYFSDSYFTLLPGEERIVEFECDRDLFPDHYAITAEGYNVELTELVSISKQ